jgi:hypothetical protein
MCPAPAPTTRHRRRDVLALSTMMTIPLRKVCDMVQTLAPAQTAPAPSRHRVGWGWVVLSATAFVAYARYHT